LINTTTTMAEDKKTDDYTVEMNKLDQGNKEFEAAPPPQPRSAPASAVASSPILPVLAYCGSSILMTVMNKYVLSGLDFNLNFLLLMVQVRGGFLNVERSGH
jgi:GDP-mannose transporter